MKAEPAEVLLFLCAFIVTVDKYFSHQLLCGPAAASTQTTEKLIRRLLRLHRLTKKQFIPLI